MKLISIFLTFSLLFQQPLTAIADMDLSTLSPWTIMQGDGTAEFGAALICKLLEEGGSARTINEIRVRLLAKDCPVKVGFRCKPGEVLIYPENSKSVIRYFDPGTNSFITPFTDISTLKTTIINDSLYRQTITVAGQLPPKRDFFNSGDRELCTHLIDFAEEKINTTKELDPRMPVAAMIADEHGKIIAESIRKDHFSSTKYGVKALHAEVAAVYEAQEAGFNDWANSTIYVTMESSFNSLKELITLYGFGRVVYILPNEIDLEQSSTKGSDPVTLIECPDEELKNRMSKLIDRPNMDNIPDINNYIYTHIIGEVIKKGSSNGPLTDVPELTKTFGPYRRLAWEFNVRYKRMFYEKEKPGGYPLVSKGNGNREEKMPRTIPICLSKIRDFWKEHAQVDIVISRHMGRLLCAEFEMYQQELAVNDHDIRLARESISHILDRIMDIREFKLLYHLIEEAEKEENISIEHFDRIFERLDIPGRDRGLIQSLFEDRGIDRAHMRDLYEELLSGGDHLGSFLRIYRELDNFQFVILVADAYDSFLDFRAECLKKQLLPEGTLIQYYHDIFPSAVTEKPMIDMHIHTIYSDGDTSPEDILKQASDLGLYAISITDHDTLGAYLDPQKPDIFKMAEEAGVKLTAGSEISSLCFDPSFDDGYYFTDLIAIFPRHKGESLASFKKRLAETNRIIEVFRNQFRRCIISTVFQLKTEYRQYYAISMRELLRIAEETDLSNGFQTDKMETYIDMYRIEDEGYWMDLLSDPDLSAKLPRCLAEFMVPLQYVVGKVGPENITDDINKDVVKKTVDKAVAAKRVEMQGDAKIQKLSPEERKEVIDSGLKKVVRETTLATAARELNYYILRNKDTYFKKPDRDMTAAKLLKGDLELSSGKTWGLLSTEEVISLVEKKGGYPIMAHPAGQAQSMGADRFEAWLREMKTKGLYGIEAFSRGHSGILSLYFNSLAKRNLLITTNGSDFHGKKTPHSKRELAVGYPDSLGNQTTIDKIRDLVYLEGQNDDERDYLPQLIPFSSNALSDVIATWADLPHTQEGIDRGAGVDINLADIINSSPYPGHKLPYFNKRKFKNIYELQRRISSAEYYWGGSAEPLDVPVTEAFQEAAQVRMLSYRDLAKHDRKAAKLGLIKELWVRYDIIIGTVAAEDFLPFFLSDVHGTLSFKEKAEDKQNALDLANMLLDDLASRGYIRIEENGGKRTGKVSKDIWKRSAGEAFKVGNKYNAHRSDIFDILFHSKFRSNPNTLRDHAEREWDALLAILEEDPRKLKEVMPIPHPDKYIKDIIGLYKKYFGKEFKGLREDREVLNFTVHMLLLHGLGKYKTHKDKDHEKATEAFLENYLEKDYFGFPSWKKKMLTRLIGFHHLLENIYKDNDTRYEDEFREITREMANEYNIPEEYMLRVLKSWIAYRMADRAQSEYFGFLEDVHFEHFRKVYDKAKTIIRETYARKNFTKIDAFIRYLDTVSPGVSKTLLAAEPILIRIPLESIGVDASKYTIGPLLTELNSRENIHIELFCSTSLQKTTSSVYRRLGVERKELPLDFRCKRNNTITLLPVFKGEDITSSILSERMGDMNLKPTDTIIAPIGFSGDPGNLVLSLMLSLQLLRFAGEIDGAMENVPQEVRDRMQIEILESYKMVCSPSNGMDMCGMTPEDLLALAGGGNINDILSAFKKLVKAMPIVPYDIENLKKVYEHVREILSAA